MSFDYKRLIASRETRQRVLRALDWLPDKVMVSLQYRIKTGRWPDLKAPRRFTEKLQWLKLNYRDPLMARCADKADVRDYVTDCGLAGLLVPVVGVYASPSEIDFTALPDAFVLKDSLGGGGNEVLLCESKNAFAFDAAAEATGRWVAPGRHAKHPGREWVYDRPGSSKIVCEELLVPDDPGSGIVEFKFFCSYGKPSYLYVLANRDLGNGVELGVFRAENFSRVDAWRQDERRLVGDIPRPACYEQMLEAARLLSTPFPEVRVDFYYLGDIQGFRFSELTFFDGSGYFQFEPDEFDFVLGQTVPIGGVDSE